MNHYKIDDCHIGMKCEFDIQITGEKMDMFREITGDLNPLHLSDEFAKSHGYEGKVAFGLLTSSFVSTLAGVYIPGERSLIHETSFKYMKPVYQGDWLTVSGEVNEVDARTEQLALKVRVRRKDDNALVMRGKLIVGFLKDEYDE